jgi:hypothetical protein
MRCGWSVTQAPKKTLGDRTTECRAAQKRIVLSNQVERRAQHREFIEQYYSVEFSITDLTTAYIFKIRDMSGLGIGILIKEDSDILQHINIGDTLDLKYNPIKATASPEYFRTEIKHITRGDQDHFCGHVLVGLSLIEKGGP